MARRGYHLGFKRFKGFKRFNGFKGVPPHPFLVASPRAETAARIAGDRGPVGSPRRA
jgi:hypothetical protein